MFNNSLTKAAVLLAATLFMASTAMANTVKIGFVDVQAVAASIPQSATMQETLRTEFAARIEQVNQLETDIGFNMEKLRRDGPTMSEQQQQELAKKIGELRQQYETLARPLDEQMRARQNEERNKILGLIKTAIDVVAEREKFDIVLNATSAVYAKPQYDISDAVAAQASKAK
ncbi:OmpH family outer membrane protein [Arsukibacterium sp.]|uniref:OmpH family outer membrane protein n=1 Tax=Arsukibacterium sp. TaxID=1977258 RepID=UPI002FD96434